jgi:hypothetical protein
MANRPWLDDVRARLARHALPPIYVRRFMEELSDHLEDLMEETMSTVSEVYSRLGEPEQVANAAATAYRRRSFLGRHPAAAFLLFAVSPIAAMIALEAAALLLIVAAAELIGENTLFSFTHRLGAFGQTTVPYVLTFITVVVPSVALCILYCKLGKRLGMKKGWMFASCAVVSFMAMCIFWSASFSNMPGQNRLACGLGFTLGGDWIPLLRSLCQFIIPLAVGWGYIRRQGKAGQTQLAA